MGGRPRPPIVLRARQRRRRLGGLLFVLPALAVLAVFRLVPIGEAFWLSLTNWDGFSSPTWAGLANFSEVFGDENFHLALKNNLLILVALPVWIAVPFLLAVALYSKVPGWRAFRLALFLPAVFSPAVLGVYYGIVLRPDGPLNQALRGVGLDLLAQEWLMDGRLALWVVIAIVIWSTCGIGVLIFLAGLGNIDPELMDAARIDGARWASIQRYVVVPALLPVLEVWALVISVAAFTGVFPLIYSLTGGGPGHSTFVVDYAIYNEAFVNGRLGYASAIGVVLFAILTAVAVIQWLLFRRYRRAR